MEALRGDLSAHTTEGYAYRVDLRLRPYGTSGQLVFTLPALDEYYGQSRSPVGAAGAPESAAGSRGPGPRTRRSSDAARKRLLVPRRHAEVAAAIDTPAPGGGARPFPERSHDTGHQDGARRAARRGVPGTGAPAVPRARSPRADLRRNAAGAESTRRGGNPRPRRSRTSSPGTMSSCAASSTSSRSTRTARPTACRATPPSSGRWPGSCWGAGPPRRSSSPPSTRGSRGCGRRTRIR